MTIVVITHNSALTDMGDRIIRMKNGLVSVTTSITSIPVERIEW